MTQKYYNMLNMGGDSSRIISFLQTMPIEARSSTVIVAASDSSLQSQQGADYQCTGTDDNITIQTAINSLTTGGIVQLTEGTFNLGTTGTLHSIELTDNITLIGQGKVTKLIIGTGVQENVIGAETCSNITIKNMELDGNKANNTEKKPNADNRQNGIYFNTVTDSCVENVYTHDNIFHGIILVNGSNNNRIIQNDARNNTYRPIHSHSNCCYNVYDGNYCNNNGDGGLFSGLFVIYNGNNDNIVTNNIIVNENKVGMQITGEDPGTPLGACYRNIVANNTILLTGDQNKGIEITNASTLYGTVIEGNIIKTTGHGIIVASGVPSGMIISNNNITSNYKSIYFVVGGNNITINGNSAVSVGQEGMMLTGLINSRIVNNYVEAHNTWDGIKLTGCVGNIFSTNNFYNCKYAIEEVSGNLNNIIKDNIAKTIATDPYFVLESDDDSRDSGNMII